LIFVTGGTGFIGTHLLRELVTRGEKVRALRRGSSKVFLEKNLTQEIDWVEGDVQDEMSLEDAMRGCDEVYHCAAFVRFLPQDRRRLMEVNVRGTTNVVDTALASGIRKLVHVSSVAAIGRNRDNELVNENTIWENSKLHSNYAISKFLAEREVWRGMAEGLNAVIVNPSLVLGAGNWNEGPPELFHKIWKGLFLYTEGGTGVVAAEDVARLMIQFMKSGISGERFIINAETWSFKDLLFLIADQLGVRRPRLKASSSVINILWPLEMMKSRLLGKKPLISKESARMATHWSRFDNTKIVKTTGYQFMPITRCIEETAQKFLQAVDENQI